MQKRILAMAMATAFTAGAIAQTAVAAPGNGPDTDRVMVKFKQGKKDHVLNKVRGAKGKVHHALDKNNIVAASISVDQLDALKNDPDVVSVEVDAPRYPLAETTPWGITRVQAAEAIAAGADGSGIKVCVIDSGAYAGHEDFSGVTMNGSANEGDNWASDTCGHGTHVAGTIAAAANDTGVIGVSPDGKVELHIVKVFDGLSCDWTYSSDLIAAAEECQEAGARIINMSLGGAYSSTFERDAFDKLYAEGVLSIAAAGNDFNSSYNYPASYDSVVSVAAIDENNARANFSQYNDQVELAAPGVDVLSTVPWRESNLHVDGALVESLPFRGTMVGQASGELVDGEHCSVAGDWLGKIVMCERDAGSFTQFWTMAQNAAASGAAGMILYNNAPGHINGWFGVGNTSTIPALSVTQANGQDLVANHVGEWTEISSVFEQDVDAYGFKNGTSMASPHVAGVAALVWSAAPEKSNREVRLALGATAIDIADPGYDVQTGWGLVQAADAAEELKNGNVGPVAGSAPRFLIANSEWTQNHALETTLFWTAGEGTVDVVRNNEVVQSAVANSGIALDTARPTGDGTYLYKVCNAGTNVCSNVTTINFDGRDVPPNNSGKWDRSADRSMLLADGAGDQVQPVLAALSNGDMYVSWLDSPSKFDVRLQRVDRKGRAQWAREGVLVADRNLSFTTAYGLDTDVEDNALVGYRIADANGLFQVYAQKVSPNGDLMWGDDGVVLTDAAISTFVPLIAGTTDGGAVLAWTDNASEIWMQKLDADGNILWGEPVKVIKPEPNASFRQFSIDDLKATTDGHVILSWKATLGRFESAYWAQKFDANAQPVWDAEHVRIFNDSSLGGMPRGGRSEIVTDGQGGALFCWQYTFGVAGTDVRVQRIAADGTPLFPLNGSAVSTDDVHFRGETSCTYDAATDTTYVGYMQRNSSNTAFGVMAQRFDGAGNRMWGDHGQFIVPMGPGDKGAVRTLPADNGAIFAWGLNERPAPMYLQASRLDSEGQFVWDNQIMTFKSAPNWMSAPATAVDKDGRAYFAWSEFVTYDDDDVRMQSISADGRIGK